MRDTVAIRLTSAQPLRVKYTIGDAGDLNHFGHVVNADDVRAAENACRYSGGCAPDAFVGRSGLAVLREGRAEKTFARSAHEEGVAKPGELWELLQQLVVLREILAKADSRIEHDLRFRHAGFSGPS